MYATEKLARWVVSIDAIPADVRQSVVNVVADAIAAAAAGFTLKGSVAAQRTALQFWGGGPSSVWFTRQKGFPQAAAFANSMATSLLDFDDGHRAAGGHPGAAVVPAVFAAAEETGAPAERVLTAIAIGYEVGIRIAAACNLRAIDTLASGRWCGQGVAAALGWLKGDDATTIAHAIATAGAFAPHDGVIEYTQVGNHIKEAIPYATANGFLALLAARNGAEGPLDILDNEYYANDKPVPEEGHG